ncbi:hypothetical protein SERLADRAFT_378615, partial [Serpula lacrymans var. lacrymans S7.9]
MQTMNSANSGNLNKERRIRNGTIEQVMVDSWQNALQKCNQQPTKKSTAIASFSFLPSNKYSSWGITGKSRQYHIL